MKSETNDIYEMLDTLSLPVAAQRFAELSKSPEFGSYTALQFIREVLEPQYIETLNKRFETNLRLSSLINWIYRCAESACPVFWKSPVRKEEITVPDR